MKVVLLRTCVQMKKQSLLFLKRLVKRVTKGSDIMLALDCASSEFYKNGQYILAGEGNKKHSQATNSLII